MRNGSGGVLPTVKAQTPTWMASCPVERGCLSPEPELQDSSVGLLLKRTSSLISSSFLPYCQRTTELPLWARLGSFHKQWFNTFKSISILIACISLCLSVCDQSFLGKKL